MSAAGRIGVRVLRTRWFVRFPTRLYAHGLGWLLGARFLQLEHTGRRSGKVRTVVLEVVDRPDARTYRVLSGLGTGSQWYRNVVADPQVRISCGRLRSAAARATVLPEAERTKVFDDYRRDHPRAWASLSGVLNEQLADGQDFASTFPVVDFTLDGPTT